MRFLLLNLNAFEWAISKVFGANYNLFLIAAILVKLIGIMHKQLSRHQTYHFRILYLLKHQRILWSNHFGTEAFLWILLSIFLLQELSKWLHIMSHLTLLLSPLTPNLTTASNLTTLACKMHVTLILSLEIQLIFTPLITHNSTPVNFQM